MEKLPFADKESIQCAVVEIEEVRCDMNADFTEQLADSERFDEGRFWKRRRDFEKKWRDPDVQRREEERKKQGLPARLGVLPHSAWPKRSKARKPNKSTRKSVPGSVGSNVHGDARSVDPSRWRLSSPQVMIICAMLSRCI